MIQPSIRTREKSGGQDKIIKPPTNLRYLPWAKNVTLNSKKQLKVLDLL